MENKTILMEKFRDETRISLGIGTLSLNKENLNEVLLYVSYVPGVV